ncbi:MAG: carbohydrate-binding protein, partial [Microbacterium sp.]
SVKPAPETVYGVDAAERIPLDTPVDITVSVDHRGHTDPVDGPVTFRASTGERIIVPARAGELTEETLTIVPTGTPGERAITVDVLVGGEVVMQRQLLVTVVDHRSTFRVSPTIGTLDPLEAGIEVTIANSSIESTLEITGVTWEIDGAEASGDEAASIPAGESTTLHASVTGAELWRSHPYTAKVTFSDGIVRTLSGTLGFNPVPQDGTSPELAVDLLEFGDEVSLEEPSTGPDDLSGTVRLSRTAEGLVVEASVVDDVHDNTLGAAEMWQADSIQFAFSPTLPDEASSFVEIGAALGADGAAVQRFSGAGGPVTDAEVTVDRTEETGRTDYRVELSWSATGLSAESEAFGFSILVNDADGEGRTGYLEWGSGIGESKDPSQYNPMLVVERDGEPSPKQPAWDAEAAYAADSEVSHDGKVYLAAWWTSGETPGTSTTGAWQEIVTAGDGTAVWTPSRIFTGGERAWHDDVLYQAAWWTRDQEPVSSGGPWRPVE